jgi:hypothetical protein
MIALNGNDGEVVYRLKRRAIRRLEQGNFMEAIDDIKYIIDELKLLHQNEEAILLEQTLQEFILEEVTPSSSLKIKMTMG